MKILNLFAGLGGNRKLWGEEHEITAVEINPRIAEIYKHFFPKDNVIIGDANEYLLNNYDRFDFIWSSPVCKTHSRANLMMVGIEQIKPRFIDLSLWQQIIFLQFWYKKGIWVIENVIPYYKPLIPPTFKLGRHLYWSNRFILGTNFRDTIIKKVKGSDKDGAFDLSNFSGINKREALRNCVDPEQGKFILDNIFNNNLAPL